METPILISSIPQLPSLFPFFSLLTFKPSSWESDFHWIFHWMFSFCSRKWKYVNYMLVYTIINLLHGFPGLKPSFQSLFDKIHKDFSTEELDGYLFKIHGARIFQPTFRKKLRGATFAGTSACDFSAMCFFHHIQILKDSLLNEQTTILNWKVKHTILNLLPPMRGCFVSLETWLLIPSQRTSQVPHAVSTPKIFRLDSTQASFIYFFPTLQSFSTCFDSLYSTLCFSEKGKQNKT